MKNTSRCKTWGPNSDWQPLKLGAGVKKKLWWNNILIPKSFVRSSQIITSCSRMSSFQLPKPELVIRQIRILKPEDCFFCHPCWCSQHRSQRYLCQPITQQVHFSSLLGYRHRGWLMCWCLCCCCYALDIQRGVSVNSLTLHPRKAEILLLGSKFLPGSLCCQLLGLMAIKLFVAPN